MIKVCFRHKRVNEVGTWQGKADINAYMLWLKKPALIAYCDICQQEQNVRETIRALREVDK